MIYPAQFRHSLFFSQYSLIQKNAANQLIAAFFAEKGGFEPPVRLPVRQFSKLLV